MKRIVLVTMLCLGLSGCVNPDDVRTLDNRVYQQTQRIDALEKQVDEATQVDPQKADTWSQVQAMRQELAEAKGELTLLRRELDEVRSAREAEAQQRNAMSEDIKDFKIAWQRLNSQLGTDVDLAAIRAERMPAPMPLPGVEGNATMPGEQNATAMPADDATAPADDAEQTDVQGPQTQDEESGAVRSSLDADAAMTLYKSARASFEAREYKQGIALWEEFIVTFPGHKLIPNALFWQGECYYQLKDYARAVLKYQAVIDNHKKSTKFPTTLLKQGISFMRLDKPKMGRLRLEEVVDSFPSTAEGKRAAAILKDKN